MTVLWTSGMGREPPVSNFLFGIGQMVRLWPETHRSSREQRHSLVLWRRVKFGPGCVKTHQWFNSLKYWLHRKPHIERSPFPNGFGAPENLLILNFHTAWAESTRSRQVHSINSMYSRSAGLHGLSSHGLNEGLVYLESVKRTENPS